MCGWHVLLLFCCSRLRSHQQLLLRPPAALRERVFCQAAALLLLLQLLLSALTVELSNTLMLPAACCLACSWAPSALSRAATPRNHAPSRSAQLRLVNIAALHTQPAAHLPGGLLIRAGAAPAGLPKTAAALPSPLSVCACCSIILTGRLLDLPMHTPLQAGSWPGRFV